MKVYHSSLFTTSSNKTVVTLELHVFSFNFSLRVPDVVPLFHQHLDYNIVANLTLVFTTLLL